MKKIIKCRDFFVCKFIETLEGLEIQGFLKADLWH
jgi:hypothetical protein